MDSNVYSLTLTTSGYGLPCYLLDKILDIMELNHFNSTI